MMSELSPDLASGLMSTSRRRRLTVGFILIVMTMSSCGDVREDLQDNLNRLPIPAHMKRVENLKEGSAGCFGGLGAACPSATSYYLTSEGIKQTCVELAAAIETWEVRDPQLRLRRDPSDGCTISGSRNGDALEAAVFAASAYTPGLTATVSSSSVAAYTTASSVTLTADGIVMADVITAAIGAALLAAPVGIGLFVTGLIGSFLIRRRRVAGEANGQTSSAMPRRMKVVGLIAAAPGTLIALASAIDWLLSL